MIADIVVASVVIIAGFIGYKTGFMKALINVVSYVISVVISFLLYPVLSDALMKTQLFPYLTKCINENYVSKSIAEGSEIAFGMFSKYISESVEKTAESISKSIAEFLIGILAFVLIVIICKIGISLIAKGLNLATKAPVIKQINRCGGMVLGVVTGIMLLYIALAAVAVSEPLKAENRIMDELNKSWIAAEMYENNILLQKLGKVGFGEQK